MAKYVLSERGVRRLQELLNSRGRAGASRGGGDREAFEDDLEYPFAVRWAASAGEGGAWIVWLPSEHCLRVGNEAVELREDLEDVGGDYPEGWYVVPDDALPAEGGTLWLNITINGGEDGETTAEFSDAPYEESSASGSSSSSSSGPRHVDVPICECETDEDTDAKRTVQLVNSEIIIDDGTGKVTRVAGDTDAAEWVEVTGLDVRIQAYPGDDGDESIDNCGLEFTTLAPREDSSTGEMKPAKIVVGVKDKPDGESWKAHHMLVPLPDGGIKIVHVLGCDDVDLTGNGGDESASGSSSSSSSSSSSVSPSERSGEGCWAIVGNPSDGYQWVNRYIMHGAVMIEAEVNAVPTSFGGKYVAVEILDQSQRTISIAGYNSMSALMAATADATKFAVPLGKLNAGGTAYTIDLRIMPCVSAWDVYTTPAADASSSSSS